jgi:hypothetical protein
MCDERQHIDQNDRSAVIIGFCLVAISTIMVCVAVCAAAWQAVGCR